MIKYLLFLFPFISMMLSLSNKKPAPNAASPLQVTFAKGADVGWLSQMEHDGIKFYNNDGEQQDCLQILKDKGINSIRLRVWVNPVDGWCGKKDVIAQAVRAKKMGFRIMIDFHYSDTWADPPHQHTPAAWVSYGIDELTKALKKHTSEVLIALKKKGVHPEWVQVGNETNDGMMWEAGRASTNMAQFAALIKAGYSAVKAVDSSCKVLVHLSNGSDNVMYRRLFDGLISNGVEWDVIAMSVYPYVANWQETTTQCLFNMNDMIARYGKPIMVSEVGMPSTEPAVCNAFLTDIIAKTKSLPNGNGLGVFYWEPECHNNWQDYKLGAFDSTGRPTIAMDAFAN